MARPAIHAGEILSDELKELGISASELARSLHIPTNRITQILKGQRGITADIVLLAGKTCTELVDSAAWR
jgi:addiction module HigA family antidote